jgi:hypothetical protein
VEVAEVPRAVEVGMRAIIGNQLQPERQEVEVVKMMRMSQSRLQAELRSMSEAPKLIARMEEKLKSSVSKEGFGVVAIDPSQNTDRILAKHRLMTDEAESISLRDDHACPHNILIPGRRNTLGITISDRKHLFRLEQIRFHFASEAWLLCNLAFYWIGAG